MSRTPFDNDALRRALELSESPAMKLMRQMENDPATKALRAFENSHALQTARMLEQSDIQRLVEAVTTAQASFEAYTKTQKWAEVSAAIATAHNALSRPGGQPSWPRTH